MNLTHRQKIIVVVVGGLVLAYLFYKYYSSSSSTSSSGTDPYGGTTGGPGSPYDAEAAASYAQLAGQEESDVSAIQQQIRQLRQVVKNTRHQETRKKHLSKKRQKTVDRLLRLYERTGHLSHKQRAELEHLLGQRIPLPNTGRHSHHPRGHQSMHKGVHHHHAPRTHERKPHVHPRHR
jgi:hypothetical protein